MTVEQNKALVRRFFRAMEATDRAAIKELLAPDLVARHPGSSGPLKRKAFLQTIGVYGEAFSDQQYTIEEQIAEGDKVVTRTTWRATHSGDFQGQPSTGRQIAITGIYTDHIEHGRIVEHRVVMDRMGLLQQLGLVPSPG
jgi:steroid delta-isomerase-like uncharacterized protein